MDSDLSYNLDDFYDEEEQKFIELKYLRIGENKKAICVIFDKKSWKNVFKCDPPKKFADKVWLPKSIIDLTNDIVAIPEWFFKPKRSKSKDYRDYDPRAEQDIP